ncbi:hypothetical protein A374_02059 [Fictibacillus macauensis ZFHKF-1]|uniref:DUF4870 domain-containing protein n=1 Tax=Fictibacillus macauensis ZFHKF-1 TaxID=1196324 RepID=I8AMT3_9BACL|nr:hypothetical protein [Fictibacillus macauensis]EIT86999.1 hypothetical protein A374_02059 [Fictibacillus macauensis ZFHKF-1]
MTTAKTNKLLSALSYFSILFIPFLFPVVVHLATKDEQSKAHSMRAMLSHLIPIVGIPLGITITAEDDFSKGSIFYCSLIFGGITVLVVLWNVYQGIRVAVRKG